MTLFSSWSLLGVVLGVIAGTLTTHLTFQDFRESWLTGRFWHWSSPFSVIAIAVAVWAVPLVVAVFFRSLYWQISSSQADWWKNYVLGTAVGFLAAPWIWLHFARSFEGEPRPGPAERELWIKKRAEQIWLETGNPSGEYDAHYLQAKAEFEKNESERIEAVAATADRQLARYRLLSILMGVLFAVMMLLPFLREWLPRTQQVQAFGVSLTIAAQRGDQARGKPLVLTDPSAKRAEDRLSRATEAAYTIGRPAKYPLQHREIPGLQHKEIPGPAGWMSGPDRDRDPDLGDVIDPDLRDFGKLSMIDRDRAYTAWLTYELLAGRSPPNGSLKEYVAEAEKRLGARKKWRDPSEDWWFVDDNSFLSVCLNVYAKRVHDPQLFAETVGAYLRGFALEVTGVGASVISEVKEKGIKNCMIKAQIELGKFKDTVSSQELRKQITPYPSLVAAYYLAAIGSVDTGVLVLQNWIEKASSELDRHEINPQLAWYLQRAKLSAIELPYEFGGFAPSHKQLLKWQLDTSEKFAALLRVGTASKWRQFCDKRLSHATIHDNIGRRLAFYYATDRFSLFERLLRDDFENDAGLEVKTVSEYLREAEAIRDDHDCIESVEQFADERRQYNSYFKLYTEQLRYIMLLDTERDEERRKAIRAEIRRGVGRTNGFGSSNDAGKAPADHEREQRIAKMKCELAQDLMRPYYRGRAEEMINRASQGDREQRIEFLSADSEYRLDIAEPRSGQGARESACIAGTPVADVPRVRAETPALVGAEDRWEVHRARLKLLRDTVENDANAD